MSYQVESFEHRGCTVSIYGEDDPSNPRTEWDNFGRMVCWHRRYTLGDQKSICSRVRHVASHVDGTEFPDPQDFQDWWKENGKGSVILPLYLYDHSGITMSTGSFSCPWDSGQVGWIYVTADRIREEYGCKRITPKTRDRVIQQLEYEVKAYDQYLTGDVYYYTVEHPDAEGDSCGGIFGLEYCRESAIESAEHIADRLEKSALIEAQYE